MTSLIEKLKILALVAHEVAEWEEKMICSVKIDYCFGTKISRIQLLLTKENSS